MIIALLLFGAGVLVGYVVVREIEYRRWGRLAVKVFTLAPMSTAPPTSLNLGPHFVQCPDCNGGAMSQRALDEHLRVRHGDS